MGYTKPAIGQGLCEDGRWPTPIATGPQTGPQTRSC